MLELLAQTTQPDQVRAFYTDAFNAVLTTVIIMVAIFGFAVPFIAGLWQRRSSAKELEQMRREVRQEMAADRERLLAQQERQSQSIHRKINFDMGRTWEWFAASAKKEQPGAVGLMALFAATYYAEADEDFLTARCIGKAEGGIKWIRDKSEVGGTTLKAPISSAIGALKATIKSRHMDEGLVQPLEQLADELIEREEDGGADADPAATEDD